MSRAAAYLLEAARHRPVLGVCFGHQLVAHALGGRVERNPRGREAGTGEIRLTDAGRRDPLFAGLPPVLEVQQTHTDHVASLPDSAEVLAVNDFTPVQAFAVGDLMRCVQFHPELDAARSRSLNEGRRELLDREAPGGAAAVLSSIRRTRHGADVLENWLHRLVGAPRAAGARFARFG
jgi:GMP synthase (glutamine-hydrolysing)